MKRKIRFLGWIMLLLLVAGCQKEEWEIYEIAGVNEDTAYFDYSGNIYEMNSGESYSRKEAEQSKKFLFYGTEYLLCYEETCHRDFMSFDEDVYRTKDEDITFYFRAGTNELSGIFAQNGTMRITGEITKEREEYLRLTEDILEEYISTDEYEVTCQTKVTVFKTQGEIGTREYRTEEGFYVPREECETAKYVITYRRYIGGYPSSDVAIVTLDEAGGLKQLNIGETNAFRSLNVPRLSEKDITEKVSEKLNSICKEGYEIEKFAQSFSLCIDEEGKLYFMVSVFPTVKKTETNVAAEGLCVFVLAPKGK